MHVLRYSDYAKNRQNETILRRNLEIACNKLSSRRQTIGRGGERQMRPQWPQRSCLANTSLISSFCWIIILTVSKRFPGIVFTCWTQIFSKFNKLHCHSVNSVACIRPLQALWCILDNANLSTGGYNVIFFSKDVFLVIFACENWM